ncbi:hypothetical protein VitviT2T_019037 [Vitis vinifera]|uniref:DCD domain-containing protein n=1 Tax=Vitis vinifera TaxID=29760 RepID=A0ABY9D2C1_VITVI|nr:uncharacterized protein LOC100246676 isoform X1 [Vitis vinifera]XP_010658211.1 uncharacterized protein LOC100246676 isoform X1 [Vitis vinifera]XP_059598161.1 uncharacterized protein LOC100246676 isoform X1 [Vitis vinifera]WKA00701.1 hypothetical protein VitviT2T_019037 [Vitis vinifera]|eukprot:XP_010658209.1 PREDICTED: uncharacterized protein LOC100246676 isoform X1 [Vitis vinifera]
MGGGRKAKASRQKEKPLPSWTVNCSVTARNLGKSDLGGVIFGCKHNTIDECHSKQLFGLPAAHFSYVRNINPGLTLFLFNYSDRKLHGIFEAASPGQMNINPYGWTPDGSQLTPYPAQVRIQIRMQCQPLLEEQFKPIISKNYYEHRLFWFELDRAQTSKLVSLFSSSPSLSQKTVKWNTTLKGLPTGTTLGTSHDEEVDCNRLGASNVEWGSSWNEHGLGGENQFPDGTTEEEAAEKHSQDVIHSKPNYWPSHSSLERNISTSLPEKKWSSLFKMSLTSETIKGDEEKPVPEMYFTHPDQLDMEWEPSGVADHLGEEGLFWGAPTNEEVEKCDNARKEGEYFEKGPVSEVNLPCLDVYNNEEGKYFETGAVSETNLPSLHVYNNEEGEYFEMGPVSEMNLPHLDVYNNELGSSSVVCLAEESQPIENVTVEDGMEIPEVDLKPNCESSYSSTVSEMKSSDLQSAVAKLMQEMERMKVSQLIQKVSSLEQELAESKREIQKLENRCKRLESGSVSSIGVVEALEPELLNEPQSSLDDSILIVGGFDGFSWLSDLDSYSPALDLMKSLRPMTFVRSYASVAKLDGELYIFGGVDGNSWYNIVESYNPMTDQWVSRPSLTQRKGSLAGVSLNDKIFAIGGGNGVECFSEVEVLDPETGRWISAPSMQQKRFGLAATELNGMLYAVGGYDGEDYLKSVERFDPRERSWTRLENMSTRRGCHSLAALNEKLYALGGYDGTNMVPTVEVFDPRIGSWMTGESMNDPRGYSGAVVLGESIYVIGGLKDNEEILDTVECYKEGHGWLVTSLKAVGKRCFFSATVL